PPAAPAGGAALPAGAVAERRRERVPELHGHVLDRHAELGRGDLRHRRLVPLTVRQGARRDDDLARQVDADVGALPKAGAPPLAARPGRRRDTAHLDVAREADPDVAPFLPRLRLVGPEVVVVDQVDRTGWRV